MKTCTYKSVYEAIIRMRGYDPETASVSAGEQGRIAELVNERMVESYERAFWPEAMLVEQRQYRADWNEELTYALNDEVYYDGVYYISLQNSNIGQNPETETDYWSEVGDDFLRTIDFQQQGETEIGSVDLGACAFDYDPRIYRGKGIIRDVEYYGDGIIITADEAPVRPWLKFRPPTPRFTATAWSESTSYAIGDLCYYADTGLCYKALASSTGKNPVSETDYWAPVEFPLFLKRYIVHCTHADWLTNPEERGKETNLAEAELDSLEERMWDQRGVSRKAEYIK